MGKQNADKRRPDARTVMGITLVLLLVFGLGVQYQAYLSGIKPSVAEATDIVAVADFADSKAEGDIIVLLDGEVARRGYYAVFGEASLRDIMDFAGVKGEGDISDFDFAHKPEHGDTYYVRSKANPIDVTAWLTNDLVQADNDEVVDEPVGDVVNLNTATADELMELPNIGEVKAQAIIDYRKEHGGFSCKEDLLGVDGIGQKTYEQLMDKVTV